MQIALHACYKMFGQGLFFVFCFNVLTLSRDKLWPIGGEQVKFLWWESGGNVIFWVQLLLLCIVTLDFDLILLKEV